MREWKLILERIIVRDSLFYKFIIRSFLKFYYTNIFLQRLHKLVFKHWRVGRANIYRDNLQ